jgi:plasmid stabilization system protein ParE
MRLPVVLRPEAMRDVEEAWDYLDTEQLGLGRGFLSRLNEALVRIGDMPELYGIIGRNVRAARLKQFTYVVYYRIQTDHVEVLAILHGRRDTSAWQSRA